MSEFQDRYVRQNAPAGTYGVTIDEGLRSYMLRIYNYMALGVAFTGLVALFTANSPAILQVIHTTPINWIVMLSPLAFILVLSFGINKLSFGAMQALFWAFSGVMGLSLSSIFLVYTDTSIARVFFIAASMFAGMSIYGYTTKRDLSGVGSFMFMGLIGIVIASLVNLFLQSSALQFAISLIGVVVFVGLTAWDTQNIKQMYVEGESSEIAGKKAISGALRLYLDFVNLFLMLLNLLGNRE